MQEEGKQKSRKEECQGKREHSDPKEKITASETAANLQHVEDKIHCFKGITSEMMARLQPTEAKWLSEIINWVTAGSQGHAGTSDAQSAPQQEKTKDMPGSSTDGHKQHVTSSGHHGQIPCQEGHEGPGKLTKDKNAKSSTMTTNQTDQEGRDGQPP